MIRIEKDRMYMIAPLYEGLEDSMVYACLQGRMGAAYAMTPENPRAALIVSGEYSFFGGDPGSEDAAIITRSLFDVIETGATIGIFPENMPAWETTLMSVQEHNPRAVPRYGIVQKDYDFDITRLDSFVRALPDGFALVPFDEDIYNQAIAENWSQEFCETFASAEDYLKQGFGFAALHNRKLVSGASTMTVYDGGAEVQVATREDYLRKGLAMPCAAALIIECVHRKIRPCWDAATLVSKNMALKLGYEYRGEYTTIHMIAAPAE